MFIPISSYKFLIRKAFKTNIGTKTIKYWGKRDEEKKIPCNSSISVTLSQDDLKSTTSVAISEKFENDKFWLNGNLIPIENTVFSKCISKLRDLRIIEENKNSSLKKLSKHYLHIASKNNFPTAAGLASSASGFAALISAITSLFELPQTMSEISEIARLGSGSACRSLFGGFVIWEKGELHDGLDSLSYQIAHPNHWPSLKAIILVINSSQKKVSSSAGMKRTVETSDLFKYRISNIVPKKVDLMKKSILNKDFENFGLLTMKDSNSFHSVCLDSYPPIFYLNDTSKLIIELVHELNNKHQKIICAYSFDAGPNAIVFYEEFNSSKVLGFFYSYFKDADGWESQKTLNFEKYDNFDYNNVDIAKNVEKVILTSVGEAPKISKTSLMDHNGFPYD